MGAKSQLFFWGAAILSLPCYPLWFVYQEMGWRMIVQRLVSLDHLSSSHSNDPYQWFIYVDFNEVDLQ